MALDQGDATRNSESQMPPEQDEPHVLAARVRGGEVRAISRLITLAERENPRATEALRLLQPHTGRAHLVGITGVSGCGKSTLVNQLIRMARTEGLSVGVLAVDPSSPFTRGAILADRLRMQRHSTDAPGTFIRSLGSRGDTGGLSVAVWDAARILDASGRDVIFIETVGAGQVETDIVSGAHTVVVVTIPGLGDSVQTMKAGLMEIADILVVNMADRPEVQQAIQALRALQSLHHDPPTWKVPVLTTVAVTGEGVERLWETVRCHRAHLQKTGALAARLHDHARAELLKRLERRLHRHLRERLEESGRLTPLAEEIISGGLSVHDAVALLWDELQSPE